MLSLLHIAQVIYRHYEVGTNVAENASLVSIEGE